MNTIIAAVTGGVLAAFVMFAGVNAATPEVKEVRADTLYAYADK